MIQTSDIFYFFLYSRYASALAQSEQVQHAASTLKNGLLVATRTTEKIAYEVIANPYVNGLSAGEDLKENTDTTDTKEKGKEDKEEKNPSLDSGMWPSAAFLEGVCGHDILRTDHPTVRIHLKNRICKLYFIHHCLPIL